MNVRSRSLIFRYGVNSNCRPGFSRLRNTEQTDHQEIYRKRKYLNSSYIYISQSQHSHRFNYQFPPTHCQLQRERPRYFQPSLDMFPQKEKPIVRFVKLIFLNQSPRGIIWSAVPFPRFIQFLGWSWAAAPIGLSVCPSVRRSRFTFFAYSANLRQAKTFYRPCPTACN